MRNTVKPAPAGQAKAKVITVAGQEIQPGETRVVQIGIPRLYDHTDLSIPVKVIHGKKAGPRLFVSAAIHGDEINGVSVISRLLRHPAMKKLHGTFLAIPIVNVYGFLARSRYLPDRRDLNRCFPGSAQGSLAAQIAQTFMEQVVEGCTHGIDLHTGGIHRFNLPQVRGCLDDPTTKKLAKAFGVPVVIHSALRDGSLRQAAREMDIPMLLFEGGEALRFDEHVIKSGLSGVISVMRSIGMLPPSTKKGSKKPCFVAKGSKWVRAPLSGTLTLKRTVGSWVKKGDILGQISDPFGQDRFDVKSPLEGVLIGEHRLPLVNRGDALFHVATFTNVDQDSFEEMAEVHDYLTGEEPT